MDETELKNANTGLILVTIKLNWPFQDLNGSF